MMSEEIGIERIRVVEIDRFTFLERQVPKIFVVGIERQQCATIGTELVDKFGRETGLARTASSRDPDEK